MKKAHLVFITIPDIGHLVSMVEFAKLLINHDHRLSVTVFITKKNSDNTTIDAYTDSILSSHNFPKSSLQFLQFPHSDDDSHDLVKQAVSDLVHDSDSPRLAAIMVDMFRTAMIDVANEFGIPAMVFCTSGAASLGLILDHHLQTLRERDDLDTTSSDFRHSGIELAVPSYANSVPVNVLPPPMLQKEKKEFFDNFIAGHKKAKGFIVNTFEELESHAVHSFSHAGNAVVIPVGPLINLARDNSTDEAHKRSDDVIVWLDNQPPSSVIFLCFGSYGSFEKDQVREIACAVANSGFRFLWSLRKPSPEGAKVLPEGFLERTNAIGKVIGWAPQTQILAHQAIGGFVSHCGWNSILESIYFGVPVATWPLYAEQQLNAFLLVRELNMAVEIALDYRMEFRDEKTIVSAERIEKGIRDLMKEENEVRKKVKQLSEISRKALSEGGSSYSCLNRFINDIMNMV